MSDPTAWVYLLCFDQPYPRGRHPRHYAGVSADPEVRFAEHSKGNPGKGGALPRAFAALGIGFRVMMLVGFETANAAFEYERRVKRRHRLAALCGRCRGVAP